MAEHLIAAVCDQVMVSILRSHLTDDLVYNCTEFIIVLYIGNNCGRYFLWNAVFVSARVSHKMAVCFRLFSHRGAFTTLTVATVEILDSLFSISAMN